MSRQLNADLKIQIMEMAIRLTLSGIYLQEGEDRVGVLETYEKLYSAINPPQEEI